MSTDPAANAPSPDSAETTPEEAAPTTATPDTAETEVIDQSAARASRPEDATTAGSAPGGDRTHDPLQGIRSQRPWHGSSAETAAGGPDPSAPGGVWSRETSAQTAQEERGDRRPLTVAWGLVVAVVGVVLLAVGAGVHIDLVASSIALLAGIGLVLLILAVLPSRRSAGR